MLALVTTPSGAAPPPTAAQIRRDLTHAERSAALWATINVCAGDTVGIRGQMPALPFLSRLRLLVRLDPWSATAHRYVPGPERYLIADRPVSGSGTVQAGISVRYGSPVTLQADVTFSWLRGGRSLGTVTRLTATGHPDDHGSPAGTSLAQCSVR